MQHLRSISHPQPAAGPGRAATSGVAVLPPRGPHAHPAMVGTDPVAGHGPTAAGHTRLSDTPDGVTGARLRLVHAGVADEDGSLVTEYGLLAVVAATVCGVIITWASNGQLVSLFNALLRAARGLVGA